MSQSSWYAPFARLAKSSKFWVSVGGVGVAIATACGYTVPEDKINAAMLAVAGIAAALIGTIAYEDANK